MPDARDSIYDEWRQGGHADLYNVFADARIPINDAEVWEWYPQHRHLLSKLRVAELQGLRCAPHGVLPPSDLRLFSRPIYNLEGLSVGARRVEPGHELRYRAGYFWTEYLPGPQFSIELAYLDGRIVFKAAMRPEFDAHGSVVRWESVPADVIPDAVAAVDRFAWEHVGQHYTGCLTAEVRGDRLVEIMPRMSPQFVDFYADGDEFVNAVLATYRHEEAAFPDPPGGVSEVLRVVKSPGWGDAIPEPNLFRIKNLEKHNDVRIYIPLVPGVPLKHHADDPWSYRVGFVNSRERIAEELRLRILNEIV